MTESKDNLEIDAVISWVDGKDPKHKEKLKRCIGNEKRGSIPGAHNTRFDSVNEIKYCVLSILKFAPFVKKIFIITDNQNPNLNNDIKKFFPNKLDSISVVDHKEIFEGYEQFLPTFNARTIETFMWRIKGLSNKFVYFNDDFFIVKPMKPEDWFLNDRPVMRGVWKPRPSFIIFYKNIVKFIKRIYLRKKEVHLKPTFKTSLWWAASKLGFKWKYFKINHTPHPLDRERIEDFFKKNKNIFLNNAMHKFRYYTQFNPVTLYNHIEIKSGNRQFKPYDEVYLKPVNRGANYIDRKIKEFNKDNIKYICAQSLDLAPQNDREKLLNWLENLLSN